MIINISERVTLELISAKHAEPLYAVIDDNRPHLAAFLPWVPYMNALDKFQQYINNCNLLYQQKTEVSFAIVLDGNPVGRIGLHQIDGQHKSASVGYWLAKHAEGLGIVVQSCSKLMGYGFKSLGLNRIEIRVAATNKRSQAIPEKLGFTKEGLLRQAEWVNGVAHDIQVYGMLAADWSEEARV